MAHKLISRCLPFSLTVLLIVAFSSTAHAGGFAVFGQSGEGTGYAYAGAVTGYGDGSSVWYNPAAMSEIDETTVNVGSHLIIFDFDFKDRGSNVLGIPNTGSSSGEDIPLGVVPNFYTVAPLNDKLNLGFHINAPFGLATDYDDGWVGRYQAIKSELKVVNIGTGLSYEIDENLSIGGTISGLYGDAELSNQVDFGTIGFGLLGAETATALGLAPQQNDGFFKVNGSDWGLGYNLGVLYKFGENKRNSVGVAFKGFTELNLDGDASYTIPTEALALNATGAFDNGGAGADINLPEQLNFGVKYWLNKQWALLWEAQWTKWDQFQDVRVEFDHPAQADAVVEHAYNNTWRSAIGAHFVQNDDWVWRFGFAYDATPIPDAIHRTPRLPDNDQFWFGTGFGYDISDSLRLNFTYAHVIFPDANSSTVGPTGDVFNGKWESSYEAFSGSLVATF